MVVYIFYKNVKIGLRDALIQFFLCEWGCAILNKIFKQSILLLVTALLVTVFSLDGNHVFAKSKKVKLNYTWTKMSVGEYIQLKVKNAKSSYKIKWKSSNKKVAKVSKKGKITGVGKGKCVVKAVVKISKKKKVTLKCNVTVKKSKYNGDILDPGSDKYIKYSEKRNTALPYLEYSTDYRLNMYYLEMNKNEVIFVNDGEEQQSGDMSSFDLNVYNVKTKKELTNATFSSSDTKVAKVSNNGVITAVNPGKCNIVVKINKKTLKCRVVIKNYSDIYYAAITRQTYELISMINKHRILELGYNPFVVRPELVDAAFIRVKEYYSDPNVKTHYRPNGKWFSSVLYEDMKLVTASKAGEELAYTWSKESQVDEQAKVAYQLLMDDPPHRAIFEDKDFQYIGVGGAKDFIVVNYERFLQTFWAFELYVPFK